MFLFSAALLVSSALASSSSVHHVQIMGGSEVLSQSEVPFIGELYDSLWNFVDCGVTVIAPTWVLTAAHCEPNLIQNSLYLGSLEAEDGTEIKIKDHFVDPQLHYINGIPSHDFMLLELSAPIQDPAIQPLAIASPDLFKAGILNPGQMVTIYGWGDMGNFAKKYATHLNKLQIPIVAKDIANAPNAYDGEIDEAMFAAGYMAGGKDSCDGDSGGPVVAYDSIHKRNVLVGVVSWGDHCGEVNHPGIYADVSVAYDWIMKTIGAQK